jgi:hypothetical protein
MEEVSQETAINRFTTISGRIPKEYTYILNKFDISNPRSEIILKYCKWEDYRKKNSYQNCIVKDSDYYLSVTTQYSLGDLQKAVENFSQDNKAYQWHIDQMNQKYEKMTSKTLSNEEKKACTLALSYYTGYKDNSDRASRNTNACIRGSNSYKKTENWSDGEHFYPVIYYLSKAISSLPFYWGYTIRCVQLTEKQTHVYEPGTVVTWLQWSSSKIGKKPAPYFEKRNTWFYIYSFNSREISQFSVYSEEKEALYSPFSHFLVFKKEYTNGKYKIYMRQIEIGLYVKNIVWVDDNILNSNWENKQLMEMAYYRDKTLKIIPKISTDIAMAFIKSFKPFIKSGTVKYKIMSDMNRKNENPYYNAGARLVKALQDNDLKNIEIMIFTSSKEKALAELKKLNVIMNNKIKVTTDTNDAIDFLVEN